MQTGTVTIAKDPASQAKSAGAQVSRGWLARLRSCTGLIFVAVMVYVGWTGRDARDIDPGTGLGYALGVVGGILMVLLLLYSVRKRVPLLRHLGPTRHWFRMHMTLGVIGPVLILYHCDFQVASINARVALYCTLLVAASGLVGRYLYAQIHQGLYGSKSSLRQLVATMEASANRTLDNPAFSGQVRQCLTDLSNAALVQPASLLAGVTQPVTLSFKTYWLYPGLRRELFRKIAAEASTSAVIDAHSDNLRRLSARYLGAQLKEIRRVAQFGFFERLFALWHVIHVPFFIMLVLSAIVHVLAVHMY